MPIVTSIVSAAAILSTAVTAGVAAAGGALAVAGAAATMVGTMGLAVTAVGMATGNKDLLKAGMIMGAVGAVGGLAVAGLGAMNAASSAPSVANQFANPELAASITGGIEQAGTVGAGSVLAPATAKAAQVGAGSVLAPAAGTPGLINSMPPVTAPGQMANAPAPSLASTVDQAAPLAGVTAPAAPSAPLAPLVQTAGSSLTALQSPSQTGTTSDQRAQALLDKMTDIQKQQLMTTGVQALAGFGGGIMEGLTAEDKIALERLINSQNQNQRELINKNNSYVPSLKFAKTGTGMINAGGR